MGRNRGGQQAPKPNKDWLNAKVAIWVAIIGVVSAVLPVVITQWRGCQPSPSPAPLSLSVAVLPEGSNSPRSLSSALPLDADKVFSLQLSVNAPIGHRTTLFWIDTEGKLHEFPLVEQSDQVDGRKLYVWPASSKYQPVGGPAGTEVLFACSSPDEAPTADGLGLGTSGSKWPVLPPKTIARFDLKGVTLDDEKGPVMNSTSSDYLERATQLQAVLSRKYNSFAGVAFPRTASKQSP